MSLVTRIARRSVTELTRAACVLALVGLALMAYSVLSPGALSVIVAMSLGHVVGGVAAACYALAIVIDATKVALGASSAGPADPDANDA
jgi:hypothetical protein